LTELKAQSFINRVNRTALHIMLLIYLSS